MPADPHRTLRRLVAVLVVIFVVAALKATTPVAMPLALALLTLLLFCGWLWGIPSAFIAVPITAAAVLMFKHIPQTEWVARLLTRAEEDEHSLTT